VDETHATTAGRPAPLRITEGLDLDPITERWACNRCGQDLGSAERNYKEACLLAARDPREIHEPFEAGGEYSFVPDPRWCAIVEVYCPACAYLLDVEYLPPGHPPTHDVQVDLAALRARRR